MTAARMPGSRIVRVDLHFTGSLSAVDKTGSEDPLRGFQIKGDWDLDHVVRSSGVMGHLKVSLQEGLTCWTTGGGRREPRLNPLSQDEGGTSPPPPPPGGLP